MPPIPWNIPEAVEAEHLHPLDGHEALERIRVTMQDGRVLEGAYSPAGRQHFLHRTGADLPLIGQVEGPLLAAEIASVQVVMTRTEVKERARELLHGPRVPGSEPVSREDYQARLQTLARAVAAVPEPDWQMQVRLRRQFEACAERIALTPGKQAWLLAEAKWARRSNVPPTMADLWIEPVASPSCFARPRPQDFDPDPGVRRKRILPPLHVRMDAYSVPNMLAALVARGLKARITRLGDPPYERGHVQVEMPVKGRARFVLIGETQGGVMTWRDVWDGNDSKAGLQRLRRSRKTDAYQAMRDAMRHGRPVRQGDLFA